ncbi:transmembrane protein 81 [Ornithorhynchus anatinus]|uniref:transmembrane protein 81 n=1 Tax=Ornithorhynchus anatinus TaxID=9258 RepID=UPI00015548D5|nr:transmembrane protein 81 [Ornithorhynchus anatinus]
MTRCGRTVGGAWWDRKVSDPGFILGILAFAFYVPSVGSSSVTVTIPQELWSASGKVVVNATTCTVTCGLGYKEEAICEVGPDDVKRNCVIQRSECLTNWICGMVHFTIPVGKAFELSCLSSEIVAVGREAFRFTWRLARGIISTDDALFKPYRSNAHFIKLPAARESDSGTYRCDVQLIRNMKPVKRVYFGLRVISHLLVNLNFDESLTESQKLVDRGQEAVILSNSTGDVTRPPPPPPLRLPPWKRKAGVAVGAGVVCGAVGGVLVSLFLRYLLKVFKNK